MIRTFRYPLYPNQTQEAVMCGWLVACCELYNAALQERRDAWAKQRVGVTINDQQKELTGLRAEMPEWRAIPVWIARSALARLHRAFEAFFRRCKRGETPGYPRFRSRDRYDSFDLGTNLPSIDGERLRMPGLGWMRFRRYRDLRGAVRHVNVRRYCGRWFVSFICDLGAAPSKRPVRSAVGVDVGLETLATLSTGEKIENPRFYRAAENRLARHERSLARKRRDSASRRRAKLLVSRTHARTRNQRLDFLRKFACDMYSRFDLVAHEDLSVARMTQGTLAKSIYDASWSVLLRCLALKAEEAGKHIVAVDPRGTSQTCPSCGTVAKKALRQREHRCPCGFFAHRDHAAALCVLGRGLRPEQLTEDLSVKAEMLLLSSAMLDPSRETVRS